VHVAQLPIPVELQETEFARLPRVLLDVDRLTEQERSGDSTASAKRSYASPNPSAASSRYGILNTGSIPHKALV
jgi:hypothetical protein